jgi:hypothetical protein
MDLADKEDFVNLGSIIVKPSILRLIENRDSASMGCIQVDSLSDIELGL